jgi:hypothetical protein
MIFDRLTAAFEARCVTAAAASYVEHTIYALCVRSWQLIHKLHIY